MSKKQKDHRWFKHERVYRISLEDKVVNDQEIKSNNWFVDILIHKQ